MADRKKKPTKNSLLRWCDVDPAVVMRVADICDGHTIFKPEAFTNVGAPPALVAQYVECYESNPGDPKETIFVDGAPVSQCLGVYGLRLIRAICHDLGIEYESKMGRGFQASACRDAIRKHFGAGEEVARG